MRASLFTAGLFLGMFYSLNSNAQFYITGMQQLPSVYPQPVSVLVDLAFPSSECLHNPLTLSINGNAITANATHCLGLLTAICYTTDTFTFSLPAPGQYLFQFNLSMGSGSVPCSPGFFPPQTDTLTIQYGQPSSVFNHDGDGITILQNRFQFSPDWYGAILEFFNLQGKLIFQTRVTDEFTIPSEMPGGLYLLRMQNNKKVFRGKYLIP
jgi:hypothetical protein